MRPNLITRLKEEWNNLDPVDPLRGLISDAIDALAEKTQPSKPLTKEEVIKAQRAVDPEGQDLCGWSFTEGVRWAEKHHGIKGDA